MASPAMTLNQTGLASQSLAAGASVTFDLDFRTKFEGQIQVKGTGGGTVAATNGLRVRAYRNTSTFASPRWDTEQKEIFTIPTTVSTEKEKSFILSTGHWQIRLENLDATNAITVDAISATVDSVA